MRILAFGGWGQLGTDLVIAADERHQVIRPRHSEVDVCAEAAVSAVVTESRPDVVVNMAAFHKVERCHEDPTTAFWVNAIGALNVARAARAAGARVLYVSTDYVFGGGAGRDAYREDDGVAPLNVYGVSKAAGEAAVLSASPDALVVRGSGMFGHAGSAGKGGNFVDSMIARARRGEPLAVVDDQVFSPTSTRDMAERMLLLLERRVPPGIYHAANSGSCSWYILARTALELEGIAADVTPRQTTDLVVRRPARSVLLDTRGAEIGLPPMRRWDEALAWYVQARPHVPAEPGDVARR